MLDLHDQGNSQEDGKTTFSRKKLFCWEWAVALAFHMCCFYFSAVFVIGAPFPFGVAGCGIRFHRFLIIAFLSTLLIKNSKQDSQGISTLKQCESVYTNIFTYLTGNFNMYVP